LASLSFTATAFGDYDLGIASELSNFNQGVNSLFHGAISMTQALSIDVAEANAPAPVPEPATVVLLGVGLVGLAGYRKRMAK
jgi:hypothetical protein